jgi:uncharacterized protein YndB with AHSA1/START domain
LLISNRIEKSIDLKAPVSRVWRALTDYRQFGQWFRVHLEGPFLPGQTARGYLTWPSYEHLLMEVAVQKLDPETFFSFTWHPYAIDPKVDYSQETPTLVEFTLAPSALGTLLTLTETGFENLPVARLADAFRMNDTGWSQQLGNIETYISQIP